MQCHGIGFDVVSDTQPFTKFAASYILPEWTRTVVTDCFSYNRYSKLVSLSKIQKLGFWNNLKTSQYVKRIFSLIVTFSSYKNWKVN